MKKLSCILFILSLCFSSFCQGLTVKDVCTKLSENPNTVGDFTQIKTIKSNGRQLKSTGKFIISDLGIVWETKKPFASCVIFTEDKMIQISNRGKISVMEGKDNLMFENISSTMIAVFSGDDKELENNFIVKFTTEENIKNWTLELTPRDETIKSVMEKLTLKGSVNNEITLDSLEMEESTGNSVKYIFSNQSHPKELSADEKEYFSIK